MRRQVKTLVLLAVVGAITCSGWLVFQDSRKKWQLAEPEESPASKPQQLTGDRDGLRVIHLDEDAQKMAGIRLSQAAATSVPREILGYGKLEVDPARKSTVRAPVGGKLVAAPGRNWPEVGERVAPGTPLGTVTMTWSPELRTNLELRLRETRAEEDRARADTETARAEEHAAKAALDAARSSLRRLSQVREEGGHASERDVQEAEARVKSEEARWAVARTKITFGETQVRLASESLA
jgi:hypothetical protein